VGTWYESEHDSISKAPPEVMEKVCDEYLHYDCTNDTTSESDKNLTAYVIDNSSRDSDGRLILPALWDPRVKNQLPNNYKLANSILSNTLKKFGSDHDKLKQYDDVIQQQLGSGVLDRMPDLDALKNDPSKSFLAHNAVFRQHADTTKCRVVLLSNLCEKGQNNLSHNQISIPGPQLNNKLLTICTLYRFNQFLLIYDLEKAFLQLGLNPEDCDKLHILWFNDIMNNDFTRVALKFTRVPFGLRFSPTLLMIALYMILILNHDGDAVGTELREMLYNLSYMDNIAYSSSAQNLVENAFRESEGIFADYCFNLQKYATNCPSVRSKINDPSLSSDVKLFGMLWDTGEDTFRNKPPHLDSEARTKRQILSSLNANYDPLGIYLPLYNRAKLFMRDLQSDKDLNWDTVIKGDLLKTWLKICKQLNRSVDIPIPRCIGDYDDTYDILTFTDASKDLYGCVLYLQSVNTGKISFCLAKNRVVTRQMLGKTVPVLELSAISFGISCTFDFYNELTNSFRPIKFRDIHLYSDSSISLCWLSSKCLKLGKVERKGGQINNHLDRIMEYCDIHPVSFHHIDGISNPSDKVTRCVSSGVLLKSNYLSGPDLSHNCSEFDLTVPHGAIQRLDIAASPVCVSNHTPLVPLDRFSSFHKLCRVVHYVRKFVFILKERITASKHDISAGSCFYTDSVSRVIRDSQCSDFVDVSNFLRNPCKYPEPSLVSQLNLFLDRQGIVRVKNKFGKLNAPYPVKYPVLLSKDGFLTKCIIEDYHRVYKHAGTYKLLSILRREFHIVNAFVTVKKFIKNCVTCKKMYGRTIKLTQNDYKSYRINPSRVSYRDIALDHIGTYKVRSEQGIIKVGILIITCLFSRAVNLVYCRRMDNESFLMALQEHIFQYGMPQRIVSDNGSPIVSSVNQIRNLLSDDPEVKNFLVERNIESLDFSPYPSGASHLGGVVESLVKQVKNMIFCSISRNVLPVDHFRLLIAECKMMINKRPIAMKSSVRDSDCEFDVITPEMVVRGYDVPSLAIIPQLDSELIDDEPYDPNCIASSKSLFESFSALRSVRHKLCDLYSDEFLDNLRYLGGNTRGRYKSGHTVNLSVGDYVSIKQNLTKPYFYPTGVVTDIERNSLGEVVAVTLRKGNGECVRRHSSDLILLLSVSSDIVDVENSEENECMDSVNAVIRPKRRAAVECDKKNRSILLNE